MKANTNQVIKISHCYNPDIEFKPDTSHLNVLHKLEIKGIELRQFELYPNMRFCDNDQYTQIYLLDDAHNNNFNKPNEVK